MRFRTVRGSFSFISALVALALLGLPGSPGWSQDLDDPGEEADEETDDDDDDDDAPSARFLLMSVQGRPGEEVEVPFQVEVQAPAAMVCWSFEYDPEVLVFLEAHPAPEIERLMAEHPASESFFGHFQGEEEDDWLQLLLVLDFEGREQYSLPAGVSMTVATLRFLIAADAPEGAHPLKFTRSTSSDYEGHFHGSQEDFYNAVRRHGTSFDDDDEFEDAEETEENQLLDGSVRVARIIGEIGIFRRGDANLDEEIDLSDPMRILHGLFAGGGALPCPEAADANVDGRVNVTDPVIILEFLFGTTSWRPEMVTTAGGAVSQGCP